MKYMAPLDGLRGYAVLIVILFHCGLIFWGWLGVQLFFALSGFLITLSLFSGGEKRFSKYLKDFYMRRALRIFPLYFLFLFIVFLYMSISGLEHDPRGWFHLITYTFNLYRTFEFYENSSLYGHLWSLSVEEQFYLVWPFVIFFLPAPRILKAFLSILFVYTIAKIIIAGLTLISMIDTDNAIHQLYFQTLSQADAFIYGALAAYLYKNNKIISSFICLIVIGSILLLAVVAEILNGHSFIAVMRLLSAPAMFDSAWLFGIGYSLVGITSMMLILFCVNPSESKIKGYIFEGRFIKYTGKISYGLYIFHYPIIHIFLDMFDVQSTLQKIPIYIVGIILTYIVASLSYKFFESPLLQMKSKYA